MIFQKSLSLLFIFGLLLWTLSSTAQAAGGREQHAVLRHYLDRLLRPNSYNNNKNGDENDNVAAQIDVNNDSEELGMNTKLLRTITDNEIILGGFTLYNESDYFCLDEQIASALLPAHYYYIQQQIDRIRGGYQDETATATVTKPTTGDTKQQQQQQENHYERLDTKAKTKVYKKLEFSLFQKNDGSDEDIDGIPIRYMRMQLQRRECAKRALQSTLKWREENDIDTILVRPHPNFDVAKAVFPHYFVGRDNDGHIVFVQRPALLNLQLAAKNNLSSQDLLDHYIYVNEYLWQIVEADEPLGTMTSIIDLQGLNLSVLRQTDIISFMKEFVKTMDAHYPQRANKTLVINAPKWFNILYKLVSPLLRESTKAKIEIHPNGKHQDKILKERLNDAEKLLPTTFFSKSHKHIKKPHTTTTTNNNNNKPSKSNIIDTNTVDSNNDESDSSDIDEDEDKLPPPDTHVISQFEKDLRDFTLARLQEAGMKMQEVVPL